MSRPVAVLLVAALALGPLGSATAHVVTETADRLAPGGTGPVQGQDEEEEPCSQEAGAPVAKRTATTFDGEYTVEVAYNASRPEAEEAAGRVLDGALASYEVHVADWGFASDDPDGVLEYDIVPGVVCTNPDDDLEIKVTSDLEAYAEQHGLNYTSLDALYALTTHHETNHHFLFSAVDYYTAEEWSNWDWLYNGFAGTSETWFDTELSSLEDSPFYENSGADDYVSNTGEPIFDRGSHSNDLYLGYLYAHDGGLDLFEAVWQERADRPADADPQQAGPEILDAALASVDGEHDTFEGSLSAFAYDLVRRDGMAWSSPTDDRARDWEDELEPVQRVAELDGGDRYEGSVGDWAIELVDVNASQEGRILLTGHPADQALKVWVYTRTGDDWTREPLGRSYEVDPGAHDEIVVGVLRNASSPADYELTFAGQRPCLAVLCPWLKPVCSVPCA